MTDPDKLAQIEEMADAWLPSPEKQQVKALVEIARAAQEIEELARQGKIHSESVRIDQEWPVHETIHRFSVIRQKARAALSRLDGET